MEVYKAILKRRTIRIFKNKKISKKTLEKLVNAARLSPSARNLQPLEYLVVNDPKLCDLIFENVYFGGEVEKLRKKENRPVAYILVLVNKKIRNSGFEHDVGLAVGNIVLAAFEKGIGCCILRAIEREKNKEDF
jgi:nitroreductase